ncbi:MAG: zf-HC2 domain-containing protein [Actinomycetota bacterium]|nr:zf-HC2 domain-containing protein [Actinomycetota bacterium]
MTDTEWHFDQELAGRYADGRVGSILAASIEQHLLQCPACRGLLRPAVAVDRLDRVWEEIVERVQAPRTGLLERALRRVGVDEATARLVAVTPSLRTSWLAGTTVVLLLALLAAQTSAQTVAVFLLLAPVLPVAGVALAFGPATDPAHEIVASTPHSSVHLLAVRTVVVVGSSVLPATVAAVFLPASAWTAMAWLMPALALTMGTLALSTRVAPHVAASAMTLLWVAVVVRGLVRHHDPLFAAAPSVQLASVAALVLAAAVLVVQRRDLAEAIRRLP